MATSKPISTISYNTEAFLVEKLQELYDAHIIQTYMYIKHIGEDGDKDHIHLRIEPNKRIDPMEIREMFDEPDFYNVKPLSCRPFRMSKEEDWFLYAVHDKDYLDMKYNGGEKGEKLIYDWKDIRAPSWYDVEVAFIRAKSSLKHHSSNIAQRLKQGEDAYNLILSGENPNTVNAINRALFMNDYNKLHDRFLKLQNQHLQLIEFLKDETDIIDLFYNVDSEKWEIIRNNFDNA